MIDDVTAYGYYWISYFLGIIVWASVCTALRLRSREYPRASMRRLTFIGSLFVAVFLGIAPLFTSISWYWFLALIVLFCFIPYCIRLRKVRQGRAYYQLVHSISFFSAAFLFFAIAKLTSYPIWYVGGSILLAVTIWNVYSEYFVKDAIYQLYSDVDEETLWAGPLLPEEIPSILALLTALLFFPLSVGIVRADSLREVYRFGISAVLISFVIVLGVAICSAALISNDQKRVAVAKIYYGVSILIGICIITSTIAYALPIDTLDLRHGALIPVLGSRVEEPIGSLEMVGICLWTASLTFLIAILGAIYSSIRILLKGPEYHAFVSFSSKDRNEVDALVRLIREYGLRQFFSDADIHAGEEFREQVLKAIRNSMDIVVVCSPNSSKSTWVSHEVSAADAIGKRIVAILLNVRLEDLKKEPLWDIIRKFSAIDYSRIRDYVEDLKRRSTGRR